MTIDKDPGDIFVSSRTREIEREDEQVFSGAGRGASPAEVAAAERYPNVSDSVRDSYREMAFRGANQRGEGRVGF